MKQPANAQVANLTASKRVDTFISLSAKLDDPDARAWSYVAQQIRVTDSLDVVLNRTWHLNSEALLELEQDLGREALIPVFPLDPATPSTNSVSISTLGSTRHVDPVPYRTLASLKAAGGGPAWSRWLAVPMTLNEYATFPVVNVESTLEQRKVTETPFRFSRLWPMAMLTISCHGTPLAALAATFPDHAVVDAVGVDCMIDWSAYSAELAALLELAKGTERTASTATILAQNVDTHCVAHVETMMAAFKNAVESAVPNSAKSGESWLAGFAPLRKALTDWSATYQPEGRDPQAVEDAANDLLAALKPGTRVIVPAGVDVDGRIEPGTLRRELRERVDMVSVASLLAPFTSENEPGTQGKRSSLILLLLGLTMLVAACADLSWAPWQWLRDGLPNAGPQKAAIVTERARDIRESMVALLLIFPAALYGQFFQLRPNSVVGHRAQASTFAALSVLFALPIFPAAILAAGGSLAAMSIASLGIAVAAVASSGLVWVLFSGQMLSHVRRWALKKQVQTLMTPRES